jgi:hypothetical protein
MMPEKGKRSSLQKPKVRYEYFYTVPAMPDLFPDGYNPQPLSVFARLDVRSQESYSFWDYAKGNAPSLCIRIGTIYCLLLLAAIGSYGQSLPTAPAPSQMHPFWDHQNIAAISSSATGLALDGYTSRQFDTRFTHEINPVLKPLSKSDAGTAAYFAASFGAELGGMYFLHRTGHHRLERILPWIVAGVEAYWCANNVMVRR